MRVEELRRRLDQIHRVQHENLAPSRAVERPQADRLQLGAHHDAELAGGLRVAVVLLERLAQLAARDLLRADQDDAHAASCDPKKGRRKVSSRARG